MFDLSDYIKSKRDTLSPSSLKTYTKPPRIRRPPAFGGSALGGLGCRLACRF